MPVLTTAVGALSVPQETLRTHLADCAQFRTLVNATSQAEALERIHIGALLGPESGEAFSFSELQAKRPFALVYVEPNAGRRDVLDGVGGAYSFKASGNLVIYFEQDVPASYGDHPGEVERQIQNIYGVIFNQLKALAGQGGYLAIREITIHGPFRSLPDEKDSIGDCIAYYFDILWGQE